LGGAARCGGILKSDTVSFGQPLVPHVIARACRVAAEADCLLAIGSSLQVYPIAAIVPAAKQAGASLIILNAQPTPFDDIADVTLSVSISDVLPALIATGPQGSNRSDEGRQDLRR
jgi:NAD-dependent deacetylase